MTPPSSPENDPLHGNALSGLMGLAVESEAVPQEVQIPDHWSPPTPAHIATLLPQYQIERLIGRGGMGAVYQGRQITLNRPVAIKVLPAELARNTEFVARFHREAQLLASLSHQGIVTIFDFGQTTEGHLYFVMEYVDGTDLNKLIHKQKKRLDPKEALSLTVQICEAMQYAHDNGVVHRDIKPANVLVTKDGRAKLADFGLAMKPADPDHTPEPPKPDAYFRQASPDVAAMRFTQPGAAMGTPDYAAPEVYEGKADERSDIYALGIMLYEMLTGAPPKGYFQLPSVMTSVDHRVDQVVVKALEIDPSARYQKVEQMKADVQAATQPLPPAPPASKAPAAAPSMPRAVTKPPSQPRPPAGASRQPPVNVPQKKSSGAQVFAILCIVIVGTWALFHFFTRTTKTPSAAASVTGNNAVPEFAPSNGETWVDGLAAYWAGDWKDDTLFAREGTKGIRGLKERAVFWPLDPKTKPMRDVAVRVLWRWPDGQDTVANRPPDEFLGVAFRSSVRSNTGKITDKLFQAGYLAGIGVQTRDGVSRPISRHLAAIDSGGKEFGDGSGLKDLDLGRAHTFEVRAAGKSISFRIDGKPNAIAHDWTGDYYERGQATEGLIHCLVPQGVIIDRFEYANLDKPRFPETPPMSPNGITKDKPFINSLGMKFVPVPGTKVLMCIHETRKRDYAAFAADNEKVDGAWKNPTDLGLPVSEGDDHPVAAVSSFDAETFCQWLSKKEGRTYRLPRWIEWSWAVGTGPLEPEGATQEQLKASLAGVYPWGREWPPPKGAGNFADETLKARNPKSDIVAGYNDGFATTAPVMSFPPNELGLYDLSGNVGEWVLEFNSKGNQRKLRGSSYTSAKTWDQLLASLPGDGGQPSRLRVGTVGFRCVIETNESTDSVTMAPAKASPTSSSPAKEPADATTVRLNQIESQFRAAFDREAEKMVNADFAALDKSLTANGFPQAIAEAQQRNASSDAAALIKERDRFLTTRVMPVEDTPDVNPAVVKLRTKYRDARKAIEGGRKGKPVPPALYEGYLSELTKSSRDGARLDVAKIKARYQEIAKAAGFDTVPLPANATVEWQSRCGSARREKLAAYGAKPGADAATARALEFLAARQNPDGSWGSDNRCGVTGLSLLAFLGRCETTESMAYSDVVLKATMFLIEAGKKNRDGLLSESPASQFAAKEHAIATTALGELYQTGRSGLKTLPGLREVYERAVGVILRHRLNNQTWAGKNGGNGYWERSEPEPPTKDFFTTAWNLQALKIALESDVKDKEISGVLASSVALWSDFRNATPQSDGTNPDARMAAAIFGLLYVAEKRSASIGQGADAIAENVIKTQPQWADADLSAWLFNTMAMTLEGGRKWKAWNEAALPVLIASQSSTGSWQRPRAVFSASEVECTALGALMLESCFRIPPRKK